MKKGQNYNHPKKGSVTTVDPIKKLKDIEKIKQQIKNNYQHYALFILGINTNLRTCDLALLKSEDVAVLKPMEAVVIREKKTKKTRKVVLNEACINAIHVLLEKRGHTGGYLFQNRIGGKISTPCVSRMVKTWCKRANLKGNFAAHTLRKTFGYIKYRVQGMKLPDLVYCFNHSSQKQTMAYLGLSDEEVKHVYEGEI